MLNMYVILVFLYLSTLIEIIDGMSKYDTGVSAGYLSDCPQMNSYGRLTMKGVRRLIVRIQSGRKFSKFSWHSKTDKLGPKSGLEVANRVNASRLMKPKAKTLVFLDGYLDNYRFPHIPALMDRYDDLGYNFIGFDTFDIYARPYTDTVRMIEPVGEALADFLTHLTILGLVHPENLELFGASLGGQQASAVGRFYFKKVGKKISRITAAGPSGPCFRNLKEGRRLAPSDAEKVDVLHTNIDSLGSAAPMGHLDYYINGGEHMPWTGGHLLLPCFDLCSHILSFLYWWVSLSNQDKFIAVKCKSVQKAREGDCFGSDVEINYLGLKANFSNPGIYFLRTSGEYPYYLGTKGLERGSLGINSFLETVVISDELVV